METFFVTVILYLFTRADAISTILTTLAIMGVSAALIATVIGSIVHAEHIRYGEDNKDVKQALTILGIVKKKLKYLILIIVLAIAAPTQKDIMVIVGGVLGYNAVTAIVNDGRVQQTGNKALDALDAWLTVQSTQLETEQEQ